MIRAEILKLIMKNILLSMCLKRKFCRYVGGGYEWTGTKAQFMFLCCFVTMEAERHGLNLHRGQSQINTGVFSEMVTNKFKFDPKAIGSYFVGVEPREAEQIKAFVIGVYKNIFYDLLY